MQQLPLPIGVATGAGATFENFEVGDNVALVNHLRSMHTPGPPVFLWGSGGCGKTHLLRALARQQADNGGVAAWFDAATAVPWDVGSATTLIVLDDCDGFDPAQQHEAFTLFIHAASHAVQVVGAASMPPVDLQVRDDLRTRLGWGLVFAVAPLNEASARSTLRREADRRGIVLSDDVMNYWLTHFDRDLKSLVSMLDRVDGFALAHQRAVTVPLIRQMLSEERDGGRL